MHQRRIPEWLRHAPAPSVRGFAMLAGTEAIARGILISVFPLAMYQALQDALIVSEVYFVVGVISLISGLMVPFLSRLIARRWVYIIGASSFFRRRAFGNRWLAHSNCRRIALDHDRHSNDLRLLQRLRAGLRRARRTGKVRDIAHVLQRFRLDGRPGSRSRFDGLVETCPVFGCSCGVCRNAWHVFAYAARRRKTHHKKPCSPDKSARLFA